jgi:hypothetical protein
MNHEKIEIRRQLNESMKVFVKGGGVIKKIPTGISGHDTPDAANGDMDKNKRAKNKKNALQIKPKQSSGFRKKKIVLNPEKVSD